MVRKIAHGIMVFALLVTTTGITYHYHYCCNTLIKFSILHTPKPCCEHPENCCRDEAVTLQLKADYLFGADCPDVSVCIAQIPLVATDLVVSRPVEVNLPVIPEESPPPPVNLRLAWLQRFLI